MVKVGLQLQVALLSLLLIISSVFINSAYAQDAQSDDGSSTDVFELETITVTSEKREKDVQTIPSSVTVVGETQIEDFEIKNTLDLASVTPNLYFLDVGDPMLSMVSMRGLFQFYDIGSPVGIYVDDVSYSGLDINFYDIERIEVLRGPQGTLYGRNSEAGVINIITKKPSSVWEGDVCMEGGSFNSYGVKGAVSGPIQGDRLGFKAAMRYYESDGYFENQYDNSDDGGSVENLDGRLTFTSAPSDKLDLTLTTDFQNYESPKHTNFSQLNSEDLRKAVNVDYIGETSKDAGGASLRGEYQFEDMKLVSITSIHKENSFYNMDVDFTPNDLINIEKDETDVTSYTQELRLISDRPESSLQWLVGLFLLNEENDWGYSMWMNFMNMGYGVPGETLYSKSNTDRLGTALFGEMTYSFAGGLDLTLGLRYDREQVDFDYRQQPSGSMLEVMGYTAYATSNDDTFEAWLPKVSLNFHLSEGIMPYFIISRGYTSGGFNKYAQYGTPYDPEFSWNYELGAKTSWWDNRLRLNAALYYIDRTDMQVDVIGSDGYSAYTNNAAEASSKGVEVELTARPVRGLELVAGAAYTDSKYDEYTSGTDVFDGNHTIYSPEYTLNLGATYRHSSGFFLSARYKHIGEIYFDTANTESQGDYGLFGAKIGYEAEHFDIYLYGENLFDEEYVTRAFEVSEVWYGRAGAPQTFGVVIQARL